MRILKQTKKWDVWSLLKLVLWFEIQLLWRLEMSLLPVKGILEKNSFFQLTQSNSDWLSLALNCVCKMYVGNHNVWHAGQWKGHQGMQNVICYLCFCLAVLNFPGASELKFRENLKTYKWVDCWSSVFRAIRRPSAMRLLFTNRFNHIRAVYLKISLSHTGSNTCLIVLHKTFLFKFVESWPWALDPA